MIVLRDPVYPSRPYMHETAEIFLQQLFEGKITMSTVITSSVAHKVSVHHLCSLQIA
jgi:hypothetical protein